MEERERYWSEYYRRIAGEGEHLDYSNDKVQAQTFGFALAAAGPIAGKTSLDFACGAGRFATMLASLGADATGVDLVPELIARNTARAPHVRWLVGTLPDAELEARLGTFDLVTALEVLQLVPFRSTLERLWSLVRPGGRVLAIVPNGECPIIKNVVARFQGHYVAPSPIEVRDAVSALAGLEAWQCRGMTFTEDQRIAPYEISPASTSGRFDGTPNRLLFVAKKA